MGDSSVQHAVDLAVVGVPPHVPADLVFDEDIYADPDFTIDMHARMAAIHQRCPDIFYTPRSGGYWVVTRMALIQKLLVDTAHFSNWQQQIPPVNPPLDMVPLSLDPPEHTPYRAALMRCLGPKVVNGLRDEVRAVAERLITTVPDGTPFEFVRSVGAGLPVTVFMQMMGLPIDRFDEFRTLVCEYFSIIPEPRRRELHAQIDREMRALVEDRARAPRDDIPSILLAQEVGGQRLGVEQVSAMGILLFVAGLDTVANAAAFMFHYLARRPDIQADLAADRTLIPGFVEESLRMYGVVNTPRIVKADVELGGVAMKKNDMVLTMLSLAGRDDRMVPDPDRFDAARPTHPHMVFGGGPHICAGQFLARMELRVLVECWVEQVESFAMAPGYEARFRSWQVMSMDELQLCARRRRPTI